MNHVPALAVRLLAAVAGLALSGAASAQVFYSENFNSAAPTQVSGDPRVTSACGTNAPAFTHNPPAGWLNNICGVSSYNCRTGCAPYPGITCGSECTNNEGVYEWEGWSFASTSFWGVATDDQGRRLFTLATGNVAVADSDEWDDRGDPDNRCGYYNAMMTTPAISLASVNTASLAFTFDSSWQYEGFDDGRAATNNQTAIIRAYYTVGGVERPAVDVLHWDSDDGNNSGNGAPGPFFKPDAVNETVIISAGDLQVPAGATAVRFEFAYLNAANDWWWAIDNVAFTGEVSGSPSTIFAEGFDSVTLEPPVHEVPTGCGATYCGDLVYTHTGPNGVSVDVDPSVTGGVPDWRGWSFVDRSFWACASGGPNGSNFANSSGKVAVADGDEFDDLTNTGPLNTTLSTPSINIAGRSSEVVVLTFNSSWRYEAGQTASVTAVYNTGETVEVVRFESDELSPNFKPDAENELVARALIVPQGATSVVLKFNYVGGNNWWWAIDDITLFEGIANITVAEANASRAPMVLAPSVDYAACFTPWSPDAPAGWTELFDTLGNCPTDCGVPEWRGWSFANKDWWVEVAGDQERSQFTLGRGFVAIADPDEWDDAPNNRSNFNAFMTTPAIALPGTVTSASFNFDSSWRYEGFDDSCSCLPGGERLNNQTATVRAIYTVGGVERPAVDVLHWDSDDGSATGGVPSAFFHADNTNESVSIPRAALAIPAGATSVRFEFSLTNARNDWFWAIDNLDFLVNGASRFSEGFEAPTAPQAPIFEAAPTAQCQYWSSVPNQPGNLSVDNSGITGCGNPNDDYYGFNAWLVDAWARSQDGGQRFGFRGETAFISDFAARGCDGVARLITPDYGIAGVNAGSLTLSFHSGWFSEAAHTSTVQVSYNGGATWTTVLNWTPATKQTTPDEIVTISLNNTAANTVRVRFSDSNSGWWAISQIKITGEVGVVNGCPADFNGDGFLDFFDYGDYVDCFETSNCPAGVTADFNGDDFVDFFDYADFVTAFETGC